MSQDKAGMGEQRKAMRSTWFMVQRCKVVDAPRFALLGWTPGRGLQGQGRREVSRLKIHLFHEKGAQITAWGTLCAATKKGREVAKVGTICLGRGISLHGGREPVPSICQMLRAVPWVSSKQPRLWEAVYWDNPWISTQIFRNSEEVAVPGRLGETACPATARTRWVRSLCLGARDRIRLSLSPGTLGSQ